MLMFLVLWSSKSVSIYYHTSDPRHSLACSGNRSFERGGGNGKQLIKNASRRHFLSNRKQNHCVFVGLTMYQSRGCEQAQLLGPLRGKLSDKTTTGNHALRWWLFKIIANVGQLPQVGCFLAIVFVAATFADKSWPRWFWTALKSSMYAFRSLSLFLFLWFILLMEEIITLIVLLYCAAISDGCNNDDPRSHKMRSRKPRSRRANKQTMIHIKRASGTRPRVK